jgi:hypothetical protein
LFELRLRHGQTDQRRRKHAAVVPKMESSPSPPVITSLPAWMSFTLPSPDVACRY